LGALGMTPEQYRQKWNLPSDYPMVASNYATQRSAMAKNLGFGLREKPVAAVSASAAAIEVVATEPVSVDTIEVATVEPASVATRKAKAKAKSKEVAAPPVATAKRKPGRGRPRKATA
jgi:hypothetical protein